MFLKKHGIAKTNKSEFGLRFGFWPEFDIIRPCKN